MEKEKNKGRKAEVFHVRTKTKLLRNILGIMAPVNCECKLRFSEKHVEIIEVDPAHICMVGQKIPASVFEEYSYAEKNKPRYDVGIEIEKVDRVLKRCKEITFKHYYGDEGKLYASWPTDFGTYHRVIGLIDTAGMPECKWPKLELPGRFNLNANAFYGFLQQANEIADHLSIKANKKSITLYAEGDVDTVKFKAQNTMGKIWSDKEYCSLFSIDYMLSTIKPIKAMFDTLDFELGTDNPVKISGRNETSIEMLLAPRIEEETK